MILAETLLRNKIVLKTAFGAAIKVVISTMSLLHGGIL